MTGPIIGLRKNWRWIAGFVAFAVFTVFFMARNGADGAAPTSLYETVTVDRGAISQTVATSGAVRPLVTVQVGSQLSGQVAELLADFNSEVSEGDLIARIDPQTFQTRVEAARAEKAVAEATLKARRAELRRADAFLAQRKSDLDRYEGLGEEAGLAEIEMDNIRAQYRAAVADLDSARAQIANAEATVLQRTASLEQAEVDLTRTEIRSPIDGVVISRSIDVGQTVAASLSAPVLFEIAQDLSRIQIEADVNEADIGAVSKTNPVSFTVDAFPGRAFSGTVETVRLAPTELQNVVTYTVIIHADNPGRILYPGMTATVEIITGAREDTLRIPNAAARFEPSNAQDLLAAAGGQPRGNRQGGRQGGRIAALTEQLDLSGDQQEELQTKMREAFANSRPGPGGPNAGARQKRINSILKSVLSEDQWNEFQSTQRDRPQPKTIWVVNDDGNIEPRRVRLGIADSTYTEIFGGNLEPGDAVIIREAAPQS
ncbi:MAG: hypothetical protein DHS20C05_13470 [Hyphococcus sp.]|nr:MAG: hypothetical protein DHS20C05_13470 [Marinicaulis sp.]